VQCSSLLFSCGASRDPLLSYSLVFENSELDAALMATSVVEFSLEIADLDNQNIDVEDADNSECDVEDLEEQEEQPAQEALAGESQDDLGSPNQKQFSRSFSEADSRVKKTAVSPKALRLIGETEDALVRSKALMKMGLNENSFQAGTKLFQKRQKSLDQKPESDAEAKLSKSSSKLSLSFLKKRSSRKTSVDSSAASETTEDQISKTLGQL